MKGIKGIGKLKAFALCALVLTASFGAVFATGGLLQLRTKSIKINDQLSLVSTINYNESGSANAAENYFEYTPGYGVTPTVCYGSGIAGAASVSRVYDMETEAGNSVVGLTNGGFFVLSSGISLGPVVRDGLIRTGGYGEWVVAFDSYGKAQFIDPGLNIALDFPYRGIRRDKVNFNKSLSKTNGICLFSEDFGDSNGAAIESFNVVLKAEGGIAAPGGAITATVAYSGYHPGKADIPDGTFMISIARGTPYSSSLAMLEALNPGEVVNIEFNCSEPMKEAYNALGFEKWLLRDGQVQSGLDKTGRAPRTAAGIKADGRFILYTVDGRQSDHSAGLTYFELANRMAELGCVQAVNLDGGASTQLFAGLPGDDGLSQINRPSGGPSIRRCANYIVFMNKGEKTGIPARLHLYPYGEYILAGTKLSMVAKATDAGYHRAELGQEVAYGVDPAFGRMEGAVFVSAGKSGVAAINAFSGYASGSGAVTVVETPDRIEPYADHMAMGEGFTAAIDQSYKLSAKAFWNMLELSSDEGCYKWSLSGDIGSIDDKGNFTAAGAIGSAGSITVSAGGKSVTVPVTLIRKIPAEALQTWIKEIIYKVRNHQP